MTSSVELLRNLPTTFLWPKWLRVLPDWAHSSPRYRNYPMAYSAFQLQSAM